MSAVRIERTAHPVCLGPVSADQRVVDPGGHRQIQLDQLNKRRTQDTLGKRPDNPEE